MSSFMFLIVKMLLGVLMVIICFSYKSFRYTLNNFIYLVILSVILGGGLYLINTEIGYSNVGMIFFANGNGVNLFVLILIGFVVVLFYSKYVKTIKRFLLVILVISLRGLWIREMICYILIGLLLF